MSQIGMSYFPLALGSPMVEQNAPVNFGDWLKATRQKKGMSLRALAEAAGVSHVSVDKAERGGGVRDSTLELLVGALAGPDASPEEAQELLLEARRVRAGLGPSPEMERIIDDEEWEVIQAYRGLEGGIKRNFRGFLLSAQEVTGDEPKEELVYGRGPHKPPK
jgi:transcriptional regulator with XRE-family HTH domain